MNIALINNDYPPFIFGGIGTFMHELAKGLVRKGHVVNVVTGYPEKVNSIGNFGYQRKIEDGINILRFAYPSIPPRHTIFQLTNQKKILETIQAINVDVIHGQCGSLYPSVTSLRKLAPVLVTFHSSPLMERNASVQSILRGGTFKDFFTYFIGYSGFSFPYRKELQQSDVATVVSNALKTEILLEMGQKFSEKVRCIHNGVDLESLDKEYNQAESHDSIQDSEDTIVYAGRLYWRKGALNMIRMAYLLQKKKSKFKIIVHGTGPLQSKMQELINSLNLRNIELKGFTTKAQLMKSLHLCKFIAIPSFYEACPMSLLEGMCLGKIPLMLNLPFAVELTKNGKYGILADDIDSLTNSLMTLENHNSFSKFSNAIQSYARTAYNIDVTTAKYIKIYNDLA